MKKYIFLSILSIVWFSGFGQQTVTGIVSDTEGEILIGATVLELNAQNGVVTDINGEFSLTLNNRNSKLQVSYTGYISDTLSVVFSKPMIIKLQTSSEALDEVVVTGSSTFFEKLESKHVEIITESELLKAACCNLSESFETNASVDVSFTDAVSGAKTIRMLGLDGRYVQINRENVPHIRGLISLYGMGYVPGTWLQSIDVGKGAGTVVNGYESMSGQINVELKKPENSETLYLNSYANSFGRVELNGNMALDLNDKWSTGVLLHSNFLNTEIDGNEDGFMDLPKSRQINFMNRYKYIGDRVRSQFGIQILRDQKAGGQLGFGFDDDHLTSQEYGFSNSTSRIEFFGKTGILFPEKPYQGWGFIYSGAITDIDAGFGRNAYTGTEKTLYGNVIYQNILGSTFHQYKTGISFLYDQYDESYADSAFYRTEKVPGVFYEYSYLPGDDFSLIAGMRADFHNLYGTFLTPRLHSRYQITDDISVRAALGRGYRVANPIAENTNMLVSSRQFVMTENPKPEVSWNMGGSLISDIRLGEKKLNVVVDYFYTLFENQLIYDMDQNSTQHVVYNLNGESFAHSFQIEGKYSFNEFFSVKGAYKYYDVRSTIDGQLRSLPYISRDRFFLNASYSSKFDIWEADATLQWYGSKRLPNTTDKPIAFQRESTTPDFFLMNAQVSRAFRWGNVYVGSENLLNFTQDNPIIDPNDPFGNTFDASVVWAPVAGRMIYAGLRYKIKR